MNRYDNDSSRYQSSRYERQPAQRNRPGKKRKPVWKIFVILNVTAVVAAVCIFSVAVFAKGRSLQQNAAPMAVATSQTMNSDSPNGIQLTDVSAMVEQVMPSVVSITSRTYVMNNGYMDIWDYFMHQGYGSGRNSQSQKEEVDSGIGSGTIVGYNDDELLILTSYHVVEGCSSLYVTFADETSVDGYIKSASSEQDIAAIAVPLEAIPEATMQAISVAKLSTEDVEVGEGIVIIGNALGYGQSVITGVVSATDRELDGVGGATQKLIQTDAAINAGNSGGCMLNAKGEIVGISEAKIADASVEGMCYAIPIYENMDLIKQLLTA